MATRRLRRVAACIRLRPAAVGAVLTLLLPAVLVASCGKAKPPKVLVIGLDGATFDLMTPWMDAGELPHLAAIRDGGVWGNLLSVLPPLSPPAWTSAATGVNPGEHGIFDFFRLDPDSMVALTETARSRRVPGIWTLLSDDGEKVGMLNLPLTDPPDPVNGFMVGGFPHPDSTGYAYPPPVEEEMHHEGYILDPMGEVLIPGHEDVLETFILDTLRRRKQAALELQAQHPDLDFYWVTFTGTDRIQHFFWKFMEKDHPYYDAALAPRYGNSILRVYKIVDQAIGELMDQARAQARSQGRELAVVILSDHGFAPVKRAFRVQSYLRHPPDGKPPITNTYSLETNASLLFIPEKGRERGATLTPAEHDSEAVEVLHRILAARDPETGAAPVIMGDLKQNIYTGRYTDKAPDLVFLARPPYYLINEKGDQQPFGSPEFSFSAHHEIHGILMAYGPMFGKGHLEGRQSLLDIAPTLMYLQGKTIPGYMEGDVISSLFPPGYTKAHPVRRDGSEARRSGKDEQERIKAVPYVQ